MIDVMKSNWWMLVIRGLAAVLLGLAVLLTPGIALTLLILFWGAYGLVDGVFSLLHGFRGRQENRHWWVAVLEGVVGIIAGLAALILPGMTALVLLYLIAGWAVFTGILEIIAAIQLRREIKGEFWLGLGGALSILFGIVLIVAPGAGILTLLWLLAFYAMMFGVTLIILGFRLRNMPEQDGQRQVRQMA
ncbi:MAG: HdeD family acid-resistance protein [Anaerolineae bacterium]|nr:HdeD family acid-resistance protein [Anaerolineae bacterium]